MLEKDFPKIFTSWFPGHMAKSIKEIQQISRFVDFWFEIVDARAPFSSRGTLFEKIKNEKPIALVLSKCDLADNSITDSWISYFKKENIFCIKSTKTNNLKNILDNVIIHFNIKKKFSNYYSAVIGIPNVGKSYFINKLAGNKKLKVENRAGVTKQLNWISCGKFRIYDTPGILPTKIDDDFAKNLLYLGIIKENIMDYEPTALNLIGKLYPEKDPNAFLDIFAKSNGCVLTGGNLDIERASKLFLKKFRNGDLGKISLESPIF